MTSRTTAQRVRRWSSAAGVAIVVAALAVVLLQPGMDDRWAASTTVVVGPSSADRILDVTDSELAVSGRNIGAEAALILTDSMRAEAQIDDEVEITVDSPGGSVLVVTTSATEQTQAQESLDRLLATYAEMRLLAETEELAQLDVALRERIDELGAGENSDPRVFAENLLTRTVGGVAIAPNGVSISPDPAFVEFLPGRSLAVTLALAAAAGLAAVLSVISIIELTKRPDASLPAQSAPPVSEVG